MNPSNKARTRKRYAFSGMYSMRRSLSWNGCGIKVLRSGAAHKWLQLHLRLTEHKSCVVVAEWGKLATTRMSMVLFSRFFAWQNALVNVKPETFLRLASKRLSSTLATEVEAAREATRAHQPRIRLCRSFDERSHTYLGYALRVHGSIGGEAREFLVGVGEGAHAKHRFRAGDTVSGDADHPKNLRGG